MRGRRIPGVGLATLGALAIASSAVAARIPRLAADAEVRSLSFRFVGSHQLQAADLTPRIATTAPGTLDAFHRMVAWIPFVPDPARHPFTPLELQEDVVRLRQYYRRQGFLEAEVGYDVKVDRNRRRVTIAFSVSEGRPLALRSLALVDSTGGVVEPYAGDPEWRAQWNQIRGKHVGRRFREEELEALRVTMLHTFQDRGFARASLEPRAVIDSAAYGVDLAWRVASGPRLRISAVEVTGARSVPERIVTRQVALHPGDVVSRSGLAVGRTNLQSVALFRRADVSLGVPASGDTLLPVRIQVTEGKPRFTNLELGYVTDGAGVTSQARWTHPNFTRGARSLDAIALVQTGWGTTSDIPDQLARLSLSLTQPYLGSPLLSLSAGPAVEFRDNRVDRSGAWSALATLVYRFNALQSAALRYDYTYRKLDELRAVEFGSGSTGNVTLYLFGTPGLLDSLKTPTRTSQFILFTTLGGFDDLSRPRLGYVLKPNLSITAPSGIGNIEFGRVDLQVTAFAPVPGGSNALMLRGTVGSLWPFGRSVPAPGENPALEWFRLRDQVLTAGGANDVRGYDSSLLGPKVPVIEATESGGDTVLSADHYLPIGGLRRVTATAELRLGLPWFGRDVFGHLFADAGKVWTTDPRFHLTAVPADEERFFYTTGGGIGYYTPVGAIRFDVGYKLNPSTFDVRHAEDVLAAARAGLPRSSAPVDSRLRFGYHLSLGVFF